MVSPFIVQAKVTLQEFWNRGYEWNEEVENEVANRIQNWFSQLPCLKGVKVPRCLREVQPVKCKEGVTFVDASQQAYGAVSYLRSEFAYGSVTTRLIASKSKVEPLTPITVPRLELMSAVAGLRLTQSDSRALEVPLKAAVFYFGSIDILWWIRGQGRDFRRFASNRIGDIQMPTDPAQWQHVPTEQNPPDLCSRGTGPVKPVRSPLWWDGPHWMSKGMSEGTKMQLADSSAIMPEMRTGKKQKTKFTAYVSLQTNQPQNLTKPYQTATTVGWRLDPERFSNWS